MNLDLTDLSNIKKLLTYYNLSANKKLGQHFLTDREALNASLAAANLTTEDFVVEVGPGFGTLTMALAEVSGRVLAIETDPKMLAILRPMVNGLANVEILPANILNVRPEEIYERFTAWSKARTSKTHYKVVSNLPYYITSAIIKFFLTAKKRPQQMVLMVQKEVAERITATPGEMSVLAVSVQFYAAAEIVMIVPNTSFWPKPVVDSAIISITPFTKLPEVNEKKFFRLVKAGFGERRKQLHNSLEGGLMMEVEAVAKALSEAGIDGKTRPQDLAIEQWINLYNALGEENL